jgi:uncharacterized protein (DUF3084 family)
MRQGVQLHILPAAVLLCGAILAASGCVTQSKYTSAVADLEATKGELDSTRVQVRVLTEQVNELQQHNIDLSRQMETVSSEIQRAAQQMRVEHVALQTRLSNLNRIINQLIAQQSRLRYALKRAYEEQPMLESLVEKYKSKVSEADGSSTPPSSLPIGSANQQAETALAPSGQVATQTDPAAANPKPSPVDKQPSEPVEDDWLSLLKGWIISLWRVLFP